TEDRHAGIERGLEAGALAGDAAGLRLLTFLPAAILRRRGAGGERRTQRNVVLLHQLEDLRRAAVAVLDGLDAAKDRSAHAFGRARMRHDGAAAAPGGVDDRLDFVE